MDSLTQRVNVFQIIMAALTSCFGVLCYLYLYTGPLNADEGWYLYAAKMVYQGEKVYQDFAYTQMPLLPYIYGLPLVVLGSSVYAGRFVSFAISMLTFLLSISTAKKIAGPLAAMLTALLWLTFPFGIYFLIIVKTYAATSFFMILTLFIFSSNQKEGWKNPLGISASLCSFYVRLSAAMFVIPIIVYGVMTAKPKVTKALIFLIVLCSVAWLMPFLYPDIDSAAWSIFNFHSSLWGNIPQSESLISEVFWRIKDLIATFYPYVIVTCFLIIGLLYGHRKKYFNFFQSVTSKSFLFVYSFGCFLFACANIVGGAWLLEHFTPAFIAFFPVVGIVFENIYIKLKPVVVRKMFAFSIGLCFIPILILASESYKACFISFWKGISQVRNLQKVSAFVQTQSKEKDEILAIEALWVAVDAGRQVVRGFEMGKFSVHNFDKKTAEKFHVMNSNMVLEVLKTCKVSVVVLTDGDLKLLGKGRLKMKLDDTLTTCYNMRLAFTNFGQYSKETYVFVRK